MVKREHLPASVGSLQLDLAHTSFLPGATLRGTVRLTIAEPVEAAVITVNIAGVQTLQWNTISARVAFAKPFKMTFKHLDVEDVLGQLNGNLPPGVHLLPFESKLPSDLLASTNVDRIIQRLPARGRRIWLDIEYSVSAKLEVAGLSNSRLQQTSPFVVIKAPDSAPATRPLAVAHEDKVRPVLGLGHEKSCTLHVQLTSDVIDIVTGMIDADVKIELPVNLNFHHVHLVLYEDVTVDIGENYDEGGDQDPRVICRQTFNSKHFARSGEDVSEATKTVAGLLQLKITDPNAKEFGPLVPFLDSRLVKISHRLGVECTFLMGSRVSMSVPVKLIGGAPLAA